MYEPARWGESSEPKWERARLSRYGMKGDRVFEDGVHIGAPEIGIAGAARGGAESP